MASFGPDLAPLAVPAYRRFLVASTLAYVSLWTYMTVMMWTVLEISDSVAALGLLFMAMTIPLPLAVVPAGALADRIGPRNVMVVALVAEVALVVAAALITAAGLLSTEVVIVIGLFFGIADGFYLVPSQVLVGRLVEPRHMGSAIGLSLIATGIGRIVGGPLGGTLVALVGAAAALIPAAVGLAASCLALITVARPAGYSGGARLTWSDIREGVAWTRGAVGTRPVFLLGILAALFLWPYLGLLAVMARDLLAGDPGDLGALTAAGGAGALVAAVAVGSIGGRIGYGRLLVAGISTGAVALMILGLSPWRSLSLLAASLLAAAVVAHTASTSTLLQSMAPVGMRGRIMAIYGFVFLGLMPLGGVAAGLAAEAWGVAAVLVAQGLLTSIGVLIVVGIDVSSDSLGGLLGRMARSSPMEAAIPGDPLPPAPTPSS